MDALIRKACELGEIIDPDGVLRARTIKKRSSGRGDDEIFKQRKPFKASREGARWKLRMRPLQ
jgi:hypothetical protein